MQPLVKSIRQLTKNQQLLIVSVFFAVLFGLFAFLQMRDENTALSAIVALSVGAIVELIGFFVIRPLGRFVNKLAEKRFGSELPPLPQLIVAVVVMGVIPCVAILVPVVILIVLMKDSVSINHFTTLVERGDLTCGPLQCAYMCLAGFLTHLLLSSKARPN